VIPARCSIIQGIETVFSFKIDIVVNNITGVMNIERHMNYLKAYPALLPLAIFLKLLLFQYELDAPYSGGISSNTLLQMIISVIQSAPKGIQLHCGKLLIGFLDCFGDRFNSIGTRLTTRDGGRLFS
jgi:DNA polymerase sigma